ncbi:MAG TPA: UDP-3-O-(3-hydroxymyristoyl)glucosamine N-acyltransferase [Ignavibacteria bacterium]|nr:UDP-3-O-(3-hydroxymyristoyl)glucosamine N-acyltransferase [Ignavibacteria bacterium]
MKAGEIAELLNGALSGDKNLDIVNVGKIETASRNEITFISNPLYEKFFNTTSAGAILLSETFNIKSQRNDLTIIRVPDPYRAFLKLIDIFNKDEHTSEEGISNYCAIGTDVSLGEKTFIDDFVKIGDNSSIGEGTKIYSNCSIDKSVKVGKNCIIYPNVVIYKNCEIGDRVIIHSGTIIGCDGFGHAKNEDGSYLKIPQKGIVKIEDDVEIGSNTCIDRATIGETLISKGVKLDNQIQIAHNVEIGENTVIAAHTGIAGSTKIGKRCMIGGKVGIAGHLTLCDDVIIGAASNVSKSISQPGLYTGYRAKPHREDLKIEASLRKLSNK